MAQTGGDVDEVVLDAVVEDYDRDSLHTLPLAFIPLEHPGLKSARLIKNSKLECMVELFHHEGSGSGQVRIEEIPATFGWASNAQFVDRPMLKKLEALPSYDVYSLRISLREQNIIVDEHAYLCLSDEKIENLTSYMRVFTGPLIRRIFGDDNQKIETYADLINMFRNADAGQALENLKLMAEKLRIRLEAVPQFLEDYADIFLSLSYYRDCLAEIRPTIDDFLYSLGTLRTNLVLKEDRNLMQACDELERGITQLTKALDARFSDFDVRTKGMWDEISAESFRSVESMISAYHVSIGAVLCALTVKIDAWARHFPVRGSGSPMKIAEVVRTEMRHGLSDIRELVRMPRHKSKYSA